MAIKFVKPASTTPATGNATATQIEAHKGKPTNEQSGDETVKNEAAPDTYTGPIAIVKVGLSKTINMGDYNSVKVEVSLEMPTPPETVDETYQFSVEWVNKKIEELTASE